MKLRNKKIVPFDKNLSRRRKKPESTEGELSQLFKAKFQNETFIKGLEVEHRDPHSHFDDSPDFLGENKKQSLYYALFENNTNTNYFVFKLILSLGLAAWFVLLFVTLFNPNFTNKN